MIRRLSGLLILSLLTGCVQRTLFVDSNPQGAVVTMNGIELGRTPLQKDFTYYGTFDVQIRKDGYETLSTRTRVIAPWWQWPPFDFVAEFCWWHPKDNRHIAYTLTPASTEPVNTDDLLDRAYAQREQLQSSQYTRGPATTQASTKPATTQSTTLPATTQSTTLPSTTPSSPAPVVQPTTSH